MDAANTDPGRPWVGDLRPPMVYVEPAWQYKHVVRALSEEGPLDETELNALGDEGW